MLGSGTGSVDSSRSLRQLWSTPTFGHYWIGRGKGWWIGLTAVGVTTLESGTANSRYRFFVFLPLWASSGLLTLRHPFSTSGIWGNSSFPGPQASGTGTLNVTQ